MAKWKNSRHLATCKQCGKSLADKPTKQKYCSLKCCTDAKIGIDREDCRVHRECKCGKTGWGSQFWNNARGMCWECCRVAPNGWHKNRVYKTCECGFVGFGTKQFPQNAKGKCLACYETAKVDIWNKWAKQESSRFFRFQRRLQRTRGTPWDAWASQKSTILSNRSRISGRKTIRSLAIDSWDKCFRVGVYRLKQQAKHMEMDLWVRKCCSWAKSLNTREKMQGVQNCET